MPELTQEDVQTILKIIGEMGDRDIHLEIGDRVGPEDTVCMFEVMKLFSSLKELAKLRISGRAFIAKGTTRLEIGPS